MRFPVNTASFIRRAFTDGRQCCRHIGKADRRRPAMIFGVHPLIALGVLASTAATDAAYVFFNAAVSGRRRVRAANWSAIWYLLSAFAVISYTENATYVVFAATGSWLGAFASVTWLRREYSGDGQARHTPP